MAVNPYPNIYASTDFERYEFVSLGKQVLRKRVKFELVDDVELIYNLTLCTILDNGKEDCVTASKNNDMDRVLQTVAIIAIMFTDRYPKRKIYFRGSDKQRTRQYQLSIFSKLQDVLAYFYIEAITLKDDGLISIEEFKTGKNYDGFIFTRRKR